MMVEVCDLEVNQYVIWDGSLAEIESINIDSGMILSISVKFRGNNELYYFSENDNLELIGLKVNQPLTYEQLKLHFDEDGYIKVVVEVDFDELVDRNIEGLNDYIESLVCYDPYLCNLSDIVYKVVGHQSATDDGSGSVLVQVTAEVQGYSEDY